MKYGVEVKLDKEKFLVVKETLERLGVGSKARKVISPSCYILHKSGKYYICHFKELIKLDKEKRGKDTLVNITEDDLLRRDKIVKYLELWGLVEIVNPELKEKSIDDIKINVLIVPHSEKELYTIKHKYNIGKQKIIKHTS